MPERDHFVAGRNEFLRLEPREVHVLGHLFEEFGDGGLAAKHGMAKMTDRECTEICITKGSKYVFVSKGKVYTITNQDDKDLATQSDTTDESSRRRQ